jgi:hypothetical protein
MKIIILLGLTIFSINQLQSQVLVSDNFSGTSVNSSLWSVTSPYDDSSVTEGGGVLSIENNGRLTTQSAMPTSYEIFGNFYMANNPYSNFKVVLRTDGTPDGAEADGIAFEFNVQDDPSGGGSTTDNLKLFTIGNPAGDSNLAPDATANLTLDTWNTFLITDNGDNLDLYFDGSSTPSISGESTYSAGDLVTFYNREGDGGGSSISNDGITELNDIAITETPEPSSIGMLGVGFLSLFALRTRWGMRHKNIISGAGTSPKRIFRVEEPFVYEVQTNSQ